MQIIPAIDLRGGQCVRLRQGDYSQETVFSDDPAEMAVRWADAGAERLHLVDLDGAKAGRPVNLDAISRILESVTIPCQLGGGIRDTPVIEQMLNEVALDRLIIGTQALKQPEWFRDVAGQYPGKLCLGLDARDSMVATEGWLDVSETSAIELAAGYADLPLAAVIYTNIANDGMMQGIDDRTLEDFGQIADLGIPVIASGGVTTLDDVEKLLAIKKDHPRLEAAIVGRALYEETIELEAAIRVATGS